MTDTEIFETLRKIIVKQFGIPEEEIEEDSNFDSDLNITELEMDDLVVSVQEKFNIIISDEKLPSIKNVSDLVAIIYENADATN